jgi:hypothetical protein
VQTWGAGPFENDAALDLVDEVTRRLVDVVESFVAAPRIDEGFDEAFAAVGLLNLISAGAAGFIRAGSPVTPPKPDDVRRWREAMLDCFDEHIKELSTNEGFVEEQRASLVEHLDRLVAEARAR